MPVLKLSRRTVSIYTHISNLRGSSLYFFTSSCTQSISYYVGPKHRQFNTSHALSSYLPNFHMNTESPKVSPLYVFLTIIRTKSEMAFVTEFLFALLPLYDRRLIDNVLQPTHALALREQL
jgi:hypothetical protein